MRNTKQWSRILLAILAAGTLVSSSVYVSASPVKVSGTGTTTKNGSQYDGNIDGGTLNNGSAEIEVQAVVTGGAEIVYDLDISFGTMAFEYDYGSQWNPTTHRYSAGTSGSQAGGWVDSGIDGTNNKISVVNNSNFPMTAAFSYAASGTSLNASPSASGSVVGIFAESNNDFIPQVLAGGFGTPAVSGKETKSVTLEMNAMNLSSNQTYYYKSIDNTTDDTNTKKDIYFALSGKPDVGGPTTMTGVGKITVDIAPATGVTQATKS